MHVTDRSGVVCKEVRVRDAVLRVKGLRSEAGRTRKSRGTALGTKLA